MNSIPAPTCLAAQEDALNRRYLDLLHRYDPLAIRNKSRLMTLWGVSMGLTWVPLLLAIAAMGGWLRPWTNRLLLSAVLPTAGFLNVTVTFAHLILLFRGRWLRFRAATECLRENGMRFRARLSPFATEDAVGDFSKALNELEEQHGAKRTYCLWDLIPWSYLIGLKPLPEKLRVDRGHAPDNGLYPPCGNDAAAAEFLIIDQRLHNQQRWHLVMAGHYSRRYLALQGLMILLGLASAAYGWFLVEERTFGPLALASTTTLFLIACREQLGYAPLCLRYTRIVEILERIDETYHKLKEARPDATAKERVAWLQEAVARVEKALASEFQYWYFGRENFGATSK